MGDRSLATQRPLALESILRDTAFLTPQAVSGDAKTLAKILRGLAPEEIRARPRKVR